MLSLLYSFVFLFASDYSKDIELLQKLIQIPSVRAREDLVVKEISGVLDLNGIGYQIVNHPMSLDKQSLIAVIGPKKKKDGVILLSHSDVVEVSKDWDRGAFSGDIFEGKIWGRGAMDMKGMLVMQVMSFIELSKQAEKLKRPLMLLIVPDEENGGEMGAQFLVDQHSSLFEGFRYAWGEGGFGVRDFPFKGKNLFTLQTSEKGILGVSLLTKSKSHHASMPEKEDSSQRMVSFLSELKKEENHFQISSMSAPFFKAIGKLKGFPLSWLMNMIEVPGVFSLLKSQLVKKNAVRAMVQNTISITQIRTLGPGKNVLPHEARAYLDIRLLPSTQVETFIDRLNTLAKKYQVSVEIKERSDSTYSENSNEFTKKIIEVIENKSPDSFVTPYLSPGATDNRFLRSLGIQSYGLVPILINYEDISKLHGPNESLSLKNYRFGREVTDEILSSFLM